MSEKTKQETTIADTVKEMRAIADSASAWHGGVAAATVARLADDIEAAAKRESNSIERLVRDAIIDYQEMFAHAPNDDAEREQVERAKRGNDWLVAHGYEPEKTIWDKEEMPCL